MKTAKSQPKDTVKKTRKLRISKLKQENYAKILAMIKDCLKHETSVSLVSDKDMSILCRNDGIWCTEPTVRNVREKHKIPNQTDRQLLLFQKEHSQRGKK